MKVGGVCDRSWKAEEQEEAEEGAAAEGLRLCPLANLDSEMRPPQPPVASKVFVQRDYSSGTKCQFQTKFPPELENRLDRQQFEETVRTLNNLYAEAEKLGSQSYLEGCLACLTAYTIFLCMETHYEKGPAPSFQIPPSPPLLHHSFLLLPTPQCHLPQGLTLQSPFPWPGETCELVSIHFVSLGQASCVGVV
uniref:Golgin subfamily A member 7 n=1 Tax=Anolis carolinensis TaxID=28377 RepID=A0A803TVE4_ANOCA